MTLCRKQLVISALALAALGAVALTPGLLGGRVSSAFLALGGANQSWLLLAIVPGPMPARCVEVNTLTLQIHDNGVGGANTNHGSGILGLTDRAEALGGTITITSPPHNGTTLTLHLPTKT